MIQKAIEFLISKGHTVEPADIPGLYFIDGRELTTGQIIDLARQAAQ